MSVVSRKGKQVSKLLEDGVAILKIDRLQTVLVPGNYYLIYFQDENCIAFYKKSQRERTQIDLPVEIFYLEDLSNVNFRIPQKLNDLHLVFKPDKAVDRDPAQNPDDPKICLTFDSESEKNQMGDFMKKKIRDIQAEVERRLEGEEPNESVLPPREYNLVELKYKLAKMMEGDLNSRQRRQLQRKLRLPQVLRLRLPQETRGNLQVGVGTVQVPAEPAVHGQGEAVVGEGWVH